MASRNPCGHRIEDDHTSDHRDNQPTYFHHSNIWAIAQRMCAPLRQVFASASNAGLYQ